MTTDIDAIDSTSTDVAEVIATGGGSERRSRFGRLYHGETAIDFYGRRWWGIIASGLVILISIGSLAYQGLNLGIDFEGGVAWVVPSDNLTIDEARDVLDEQGIDGGSARITERTGTVNNLLIQVGDQPLETQQAIRQAFADAADVPLNEVSSTSISSTWGRSVTEKAVRALVVFIVLVALVLAWRFEWRMALAAIVAMLHDVAIAVGFYSIFQFEVTPATVVAFLTILGFSLYDTIVVFDKVKENTARYTGSRVPYADAVNVSMNQVLMRSLNTSLAAVLPVLSLLIIGSGVMGAVTLREFSLALLVGLLTGSYSSIFIATPLLAILKEREPKYRSMRGVHATGRELERLVMGGSPSTRRESRHAVAATANAGAAVDAVQVHSTPTEVLSHPPRPRKKKRRNA